MKKIILLLSILFSINLAKAQIIINEVQADAGNNEGNGGEWIELKNIGSTTQDLSCWKLTNGGSYQLSIPSGLQLGAGKYLLIGNASKMMCSSCDFPSLNNQFILNTNGYGIGVNNYANTIFLNTDLTVGGGCNCMTGSGALANGNNLGDRIVLMNASGTIQDAFMYADGSNYGTAALTVNFTNTATCIPLANITIPDVTDAIYLGKTVCNDQLSCNSSYARLPDGNNPFLVTYTQTGNLNCANCTVPCNGSTNTGSEDFPTPGLPNNALPWTATIDGNPVINPTTSLTICGNTPIVFEYKIFNYTNIALNANQASGNLGSYVKTSTGNPVNFNAANYNAATGTTTLTATLNPAVGTTDYDLVFGDANSICTTCPGSNLNTVPNNDLSVAKECYTYHQVSVFREDPLGGTVSTTCTIPGSITVLGATGTNVLYTLEKQSTIGGPFVAVGVSQSSNLFGNVVDDDADPLLPNYRVSISSINVVCPNPSPLIALVSNSCLGNPVCPTYVTSGVGVPTFSPVNNSTICANSPVQFTVNINGVCTNGQVEMMYDYNPLFDPYSSGTSLGSVSPTVGTTPPTAATGGKVFINEFVPRPILGACLVTPNGQSPNSGEWVELFNAGPGNADISGWIIADGDWTATIPAGTNLAIGAYYLIGGGGTFCSSGVQPDLNIETCNCANVSPITQDIMNLTDGNEQLALFDCSGTYIDGVYWGAGQGLPDVTANDAPAAGCGNYITAKSVNLPAIASFANSGSGLSGTNQGKFRTSTNTWTVTTTPSPKALNLGGNWNGSSLALGSECPPPPVTATLIVNLPDTCSLVGNTSITIKAIYKPDPTAPCSKTDVTATATYTIPTCSELILTGNGEYCAPNTAPVSITSSATLVGNYDIHLSNGINNVDILGATGAGPFNANLTHTGIWTIASITAPAGICPPKKTGNAAIIINAIPTITASPTSVTACYLYGFDLSTINSQLTSMPAASDYLWYDVPVNGSPLIPTYISPQATGNYYVAPMSGITITCEGTRIPILLNVAPLPTDPTIVSCDSAALVLLPQVPNCIPTPCVSGVEYSANGIDWSTALTYTATDPGWAGWGSAANSGIYIKNVNMPSCLSFYYYNNPCSVPLPVSLTDFKAQLNSKSTIDLSWQTNDEMNVSHYDIERSQNKLLFEKIGEMKSNGNHSMANSYYFEDKKPMQGTNFYRLKINDLDGKLAYSKTISVEINANETSITSLYPNPVTNQLYVTMNATKTERTQIEVYDLIGKLIQSKPLLLTKGFNETNINMKSLSSGQYILRIPLSSGVIVKQILKED